MVLTKPGQVHILMHIVIQKRYEQDTTSPEHRSQKAAGCARRQQGVGQVIPCEQLRQKTGALARMSSWSRFPTVNGERRVSGG